MAWMVLKWSIFKIVSGDPDLHPRWPPSADSFNIGPYGKNISKCLFSETTWTVETKLPRNDHWKVLYKVSVFYADRKSKMAATTGENTEIYSSLKLLH